MISDNDNRIVKLKLEIEKRLKLLENKGKNNNFKTNCILDFEGMKFNFHTLSEDQSLLLLVRLLSYKMASEKYSIDLPKISGYSFDDWISDLKLKLENASYKYQLADLREKLRRLNELLSNDKRTELELDEIEKMLN